MIHGFMPLADSDARVLVLGTMPGKASLRAHQYYAHPRNAFWKLAAEIFGMKPDLDYDSRVQLLLRSRIALWDVLRICTRESSLDADIDDASVVPNDIRLFLREHPLVIRICFNGAKAAALFDKHVDGPELVNVQRIRLPSTSPANAATPYAKKLKAWRAALIC